MALSFCVFLHDPPNAAHFSHVFTLLFVFILVPPFFHTDLTSCFVQQSETLCTWTCRHDLYMSFADVLRRLAANAKNLMRSLSIPASRRPVKRHNAGCAQTPPLQTDPAGRTKKILVLNCVFDHLKRDGKGAGAKQKNRSKACTTLIVLS